MSKLTPLILDVKELHEYRVEQTHLYAKCGVSNKELRLTFYGGLQVWQNGKIVREFAQPYQAVEFFNNL